MLAKGAKLKNIIKLNSVGQLRNVGITTTKQVVVKSATIWGMLPAVLLKKPRMAKYWVGITRHVKSVIDNNPYLRNVILAN